MGAQRQDTDGEGVDSTGAALPGDTGGEALSAANSPARDLQDRLSAIFEPDVEFRPSSSTRIDGVLMGLIIALGGAVLAGGLLAYGGI